MQAGCSTSSGHMAGRWGCWKSVYKTIQCNYKRSTCNRVCGLIIASSSVEIWGAAQLYLDPGHRLPIAAGR